MYPFTRIRIYIYFCDTVDTAGRLTQHSMILRGSTDSAQYDTVHRFRKFEYLGENLTKIENISTHWFE